MASRSKETTERTAGRARVARYWPGRAPEESSRVVSDSESSASDDEVPVAENRVGAGGLRVEVRSFALPEPTTNVQRRAVAMRERREQPGKCGRLDEASSEDEEDAAVRRRQLLRERLLRRKREEEQDTEGHFEENQSATASSDVTTAKAVQESEGDSESTSESESDDSGDSDASEEDTNHILLKPIFVPKSRRQTVAEKEQELLAMEQAERQREQEREARKHAAHKLVADTIKRELEETEEVGSVQDVDDTDDLDPAEELESWKLRELKRLQRDREEELVREEQQRELERRRGLTDAEIMREDAEKLQQDRDSRKNSKFTFMQKYYHKGAFYSDQAGELLKRDYTAPTPDMPQVEMLPEVMQVRDFGKRGRTKWTHLTAEDTSQRDAAWSKNSDINRRMSNRMGGMKGATQQSSLKRRRY